MGTWISALGGLACLAVFCLPMAVGAIRGWRRRRTGAMTPSRTAEPATEPEPRGRPRPVHSGRLDHQGDADHRPPGTPAPGAQLDDRPWTVAMACRAQRIRSDPGRVAEQARRDGGRDLVADSSGQCLAHSHNVYHAGAGMMV